MLGLTFAVLFPSAAAVVCVPSGSTDTTVDCTNAAEDTFAPGPPLKRARTLGAVATLGGQVCLVGGTSTGPMAPLPTECFNPTTNSWIDVPQYAVGSTYWGAAPYINNNGEQCMVGGWTAVGQESAGSKCYRNGTWVVAGSLTLTQPRSSHVSFPLGNTWCVAGGIVSATTNYLNTVECLGTGSFVALSQLANKEKRFNPAVLTIDGLLCLVGGTDPLVSVECLDALTAGSIITNRGGQSLALALGNNPQVVWRTTNLVPLTLRSSPPYFVLQGKPCVGGGSDNRTVECYTGGNGSPLLTTVNGQQQYNFSGSFRVLTTTFSQTRAFTTAFTIPGTGSAGTGTAGTGAGTVRPTGTKGTSGARPLSVSWPVAFFCLYLCLAVAA